MQTRRSWIFGALLALATAGCRSSDAPSAPDQAPATPAPAPAPHRHAAPAPATAAFTDISPGLDALRARFQEDDGMVRVIMLVAPT